MSAPSITLSSSPSGAGIGKTPAGFGLIHSSHVYTDLRSNSLAVRDSDTGAQAGIMATTPTSTIPNIVPNIGVVTGLGLDGTDLVLIANNAESVRAFDGGAEIFGYAKIPGLRLGVATKTSAYTAGTSDSLVLCDASSGAVTITLPAISAGVRGLLLHIKKIDASANVCTIARGASDTIDGANSLTLSTRYSSRTLIAPDLGIDWAVVATL
jgi:hypothetical protein